MKKRHLIFLMLCLVFFRVDCRACGEIAELTSSNGTITTEGENTYLITVPEDIISITLYGKADTPWVEGYGPRSIRTDRVSEFKVDGSACGIGVRTYYVKFKRISNVIAENTPSENPPAQTTPTTEAPTTANPATPTEPTPETPSIEGGLLLKSLKIEGHEIAFDPYKYEYDLEVGLDEVYLSIDAVPENENVNISISENAFSLKKGENLIAITLLDPNGNTSVYNIKVNKVPPKSNNNYLSGLTVENYQLNFDPAKNIYELSIGKELSLNIHATKQDEKAEDPKIIGNSNLHTGSEITIKVVAEDGSVRDYVIKITKVFNIMDYWIYIVIVLLLLLLGILLLISKKKKNNKKPGPQTLEAQTATAGVIQEAVSQNVAPTDVTTAENTDTTATASAPVGTLKIIEPTDIENPNPAPTDNANSVDEDNSPTEVFQL